MSKPFYLTTSIAYVNSDPHIGFAMELLQADAIARYRRMKGDDVYFLTGTDEHGAKIARAAKSADKEPKEFVDVYAKRFEQLGALLGISNDDFIRTSDRERHWPGAQALWKKLEEAGDIYKASYKGMYCVGHEAFVTEKDLVNGVCADHQKPPEIIEEENYFFKLARHTGEIRKRIESGELKIVPDGKKHEMLSFLSEGLQDVSFSRPAKDISWGIPVPGDESQTMYVWCDALSNYISALGYGTSNEGKFAAYWPAEVHVIGKDILRFHSLIWIGMLLSAKLPLPKCIFVHGHILSDGKKMSKSLGNVVDPFELVKTYGSEAVRFFLLKEISTFEDGDFTIERFETSFNANLANGLGNLVSRTAKMAEMYFEGTLIRPDEAGLSSVPIKVSLDMFGLKEHALTVENTSLSYFADEIVVPAYDAFMKEYRLHEALGAVWHLISVMDAYIQEYEPFKLASTDKEKTRAVLWQVSYSLARVSQLLDPFMPDTAQKIKDTLGMGAKTKIEAVKEFTVKKGEALFPRLGK